MSATNDTERHAVTVDEDRRDSAHEEIGATPLVTVGVPVFNGAAYIESALNSVLAQTFENFELVISDNCSTDSTELLCRRFAQRDTRVRYCRQTSNIGGHGNFKFVTEEARGEFVTWLAHDDVLMPNFLELTVAYLMRHPCAVAATGDFLIIDERSEPLEAEQLILLRDDIPWLTRRIEFFKYPIENVFFCIYAVMRTSACQRVMRVIAEPKIASGSELPVLSRFSLIGEIASLPHVLRHYRRHSASDVRAGDGQPGVGLVCSA